MLRRAPLALLLLLPLAAPASADPAAEVVARELGDGSLSAEEAASAWAESGLSPEDAMATLRALAPTAPGKAGKQRMELTDSFGRTSHANVIIPDAPRADGRYGVLLALHGLGGNSGQLLPFVEKIVPPGYIVVSPGAKKLTQQQENEDTFGVGVASRFLPHWWSYKDRSFPLRALDELKESYPIDTDRVVLFGYSMGGYGTWNIGLRYPDRFAGIVPIAGGISRVENIVPLDLKVRPLISNGRMVPSWVAHGNSDGTVPVRFSRSITTELAELGADCTYHEVQGGKHYLSGFLNGNELTRELIAWLPQRVRNAHPRRIEHTVLGTYHGGSYWLRIDDASPKASASAEIQGNTISIQAQGVRRLTVFLDPELLDVGSSVTVKVNGLDMHRGVVRPSLKAVAESFAGDRDASLTWSREVSVDLGF